MARRYGISRQVPAGCGGSEVKEFLQMENAELSKISSYHRNPPETHCQLIRSKGEEITIPVSQTNTQIRKEIREKVQSREFILGELIVPRHLKKTVIDKLGNLTEAEIKAYGRKIPLLILRTTILQEQEKLGLIRLRSDEEYEYMTDIYLKARFLDIYEYSAAMTMTSEQQRNYLRKIERTRHILTWGDHSDH